MSIFDKLKKKNGDNHYLSGKEVREIARKNSEIMFELERRKHRKAEESEFLSEMKEAGVKTVIITDISKDGAMRGTNLELYKRLSCEYSLNITASGGVSSIDDVKKLREMDMYGAIIGKAYYIGKIDLGEAIEVAK